MPSLERVEELVRTIENLPDQEARASALALVQALMDFHGEALDRLMELVASQGESGYSIFDKFSQDELVANLLLLYGLHPSPLETRVLQALEKVRPQLDAHGGSVELLEINGGVVRLRLHGNCKGCPSSADTLKLAIEAAIYDAAPDVATIEAEGAVETGSTNGIVQIGRSAVPAMNCHTPLEKGETSTL